MPIPKGASKKKKADSRPKTSTVSPAVTRSKNRKKSAAASSSSSSSSTESVSLLAEVSNSHDEAKAIDQSSSPQSSLNSSSSSESSSVLVLSQRFETDIAALSDHSVATVIDSDSKSKSANSSPDNSTTTSTVVDQNQQDCTLSKDNSVVSPSSKSKLFLVERKNSNVASSTPTHTPVRPSIRRKCSPLLGMDHGNSPPAKRHLSSTSNPNVNMSMTAANTADAVDVDMIPDPDSNEASGNIELLGMETGEEHEKSINSLSVSLSSPVRPMSLSRSVNSNSSGSPSSPGSSDLTNSPSEWNLKLKGGFTLSQKFAPHFKYIGHRDEAVTTTSKSPEKRYAVSCNYCTTTLAAHQSTNANLKRHLTNRHGVGKNLGESDDAVADESMDFCFYSKHHHKQKRYEVNCVRFLVLNNLAFQLNRWDAFQELVRSLDPFIRPMCGKTMSRRMHDFSVKATEDLKLFFKNIAYVSLVLDGWSSKKNKGVIAVQAIYVTKDFVWGVKTLALREVVGRHTGTAIRDCVNSILQDFQLNLKVSSIIIDNGANMVAAFDRLKTQDGQLVGAFNHDVPRPLGPTHVAYRCAAHTIQLVVKAACRVPGAVKKSVSNAMLCITKIMNSQVLRKLLLVQTDRGFPRKSDTRWNAEFDIICLLVTDKMFNAVNNIINYALTTKNGTYFQAKEKKPEVMSENDYKYLQEFCALLGPLADATDILQADNFTAHLILPTIVEVYQRLEGQELSDAGLHLQSLIMSQMSDRFSSWFSYPALFTSTFFDPRRKMYFFDYMRMFNYDDTLPLMSNLDMISKIEDFCITTSCVEYGLNTAANNVDVDESEVCVASNSSTQGSSSQPTPARTPPKERLHAYGNSDENGTVVLGKKSSPESSPKSTNDGFSSIAELEVRAYLIEPILTEDIAVYWKQNAAKFPMLANLFRSIMSRPATTAPVERLFSRCGIIDHDKRSNILPPTLNKLLVVREWFEQSDEIKQKKTSLQNLFDTVSPVSSLGSENENETEEIFFDLDTPTITQSPSSSSKKLQESSEKKSKNSKTAEESEEYMDFEAALKSVLEEFEEGEDDVGEWELFESNAQGWSE